MTNYDYGLYCRGFVLSDEKIASPKPDWKYFEFSAASGKILYVWHDAKNTVSYHRENSHWCFMLGMAMDTLDWHMNLDFICEKCAKLLDKSRNDFYEYTDNLNGRFAIVFGDDEEITVMNDATATRSVYYHTEKCLIASHYGIIAEITGAKAHPYMEKYDAIEKKPWFLPGDITPFENVMILTANHEYNLVNMKLRRFYPRNNHKHYSIKEILSVMPEHLKMQMKTLAEYHTPIIAVTGGNDSRVTMAASREVRNKATYFTFANKESEAKARYQQSRLVDLNYARQVCDLYGLDFRPLEIKPPVPQEMLEIMKRNHYHSHIPSTVPEYINELPRGIHVQSSLVEIVRDLTYVYEKPAKNTKHTHQEIMAGWMMYWSRRKEVKEYVDGYWDRNQWDDIYDYERVRLFYWEHRMSTWIGASVLLENDWAFDTYLLLNCRRLLEMGFCLPKYARDKNLITKYTVKALWPELLFRIENSEDTLFDHYDVDPCGKIPIKGNCRIKSNDPERVLLLDRLYSAMLGFDKVDIGKGDYCALEIAPESLKKHIRITLSAPADSLLERGVAEVYVNVNSKVVSHADLAEISGNSLVITVNVSEFTSLEIGIRSMAEINSEEYGNYVMVNIDSVVSSDEPIKSPREINCFL